MVIVGKCGGWVVGKCWGWVEVSDWVGFFIRGNV